MKDLSILENNNDYSIVMNKNIHTTLDVKMFTILVDEFTASILKLRLLTD